jgi:TPP-dependent pyruvate/acetoin dehydrogenase alpha subunit
MTPVTPESSVLIEMFTKMALIRLCDAHFISVIRSGRLAAPYYSPRGQEAIAAAMAVNLRTDDYLVTIYRGLHDHLAKGVPLRELWAEYAGKAAGSCKGKGGPMHITHPASGVMVTTGVVGSGLPIAAGLAWASQVKGEDRVTVASFGDGASNIGAFHESLNLASVWKLPVIFLCQNNRYAEHTRYEHGTSAANVADRAAGYSMPGIIVDGNDPVAMWQVCKTAVERARAGLGPTLIEAKTFRFHGHVLGDPGEYIPKEEYARALESDPVPIFRAQLIAAGHLNEASAARIEEGVRSEIEAAAEFALSAADADIADLRRDVYAEKINP